MNVQMSGMSYPTLIGRPFAGQGQGVKDLKQQHDQWPTSSRQNMAETQGEDGKQLGLRLPYRSVPIESCSGSALYHILMNWGIKRVSSSSWSASCLRQLSATAFLRWQKLDDDL
jgi:hypothetical protein